jgi:hypothetical protein
MSLGGAEAPPLESRGLKSFSLQAGRSSFAVGNIELTGQLPDGELIWSHTGEPGYRYLIERSLEGFEWRPFRVITNQTSVATFTDSINPGGGVGFYRSRILD